MDAQGYFVLAVFVPLIFAAVYCTVKAKKQEKNNSTAE